MTALLRALAAFRLLIDPTYQIRKHRQRLADEWGAR